MDIVTVVRATGQSSDCPLVRWEACGCPKNLLVGEVESSPFRGYDDALGLRKNATPVTVRLASAAPAYARMQS
jgi:hypothetical protein